MSLFWKIFWTVVIVITGAVAMIAVIDLFKIILDFAAYELWEFLIAVLGAALAAVPAWFAWKGTKLIPFITILPIRIIMIVVGCFFPPLLVVFALIGIWLKS